MFTKVILFLSLLFFAVGILILNHKPLIRLWKKVMEYEGKSTFKGRLEILTGEINKHFFKRELHEAKQTLGSLKKGYLFNLVQLLSVAFCILGIVVSIKVKNAFLLPVFASIGALAPFLYIKTITWFYKKRINFDLENSLYTITYNYLINDDFLTVVKDSLTIIAPTVQETFRAFVRENTLIDADIKAGINNLKFRINNPVFHEWCNCVIQCQFDSTLKGNLLPIVNRMSDNQNIQHEVDTLISGAKRSAYSVLFMMSLFPLLMKFVNPEWAAAYSTAPGKFSIALTIVVVIFSIWRISVLSKPIELEESK